MSRIIANIALCLFMTTHLYALAAFPGAQGHGSDTIGGRGGTVYVVNTLSDDTDDGVTFRDAVTASGARIVVFAVSGNINLTSKLTISNPYLTIAGQTSPGGICITGARTAVNTHDVIITHMRFRIGSQGYIVNGGDVDPDKARSLEIYGDGMYYDNAGYNVIVDHCSFSWAADTNLSIAENAYDITVSWCMLSYPYQISSHSEGAVGHDYNMLLWGRYTDESPARMYTLHHNYFSHGGGRCPDINYNGYLESVNNVVFDTDGGKSPHLQSVTGTTTTPTADFIHNYFRKGDQNNEVMYEARYYNEAGLTPSPIIYMTGCIGAYRTTQDDPQWAVGTSYTAVILPTDWRKETPVQTATVTPTTMSLTYAGEIVAACGATKPTRDSLDATVAANWTSVTSARVDEADITYPTDFPTFSTSGDNPTDSDSDGMWDTTEVTLWGNITVHDADDVLSTEYTSIEAYLHYLGGYQESESPSTPTITGGFGGSLQ